MPHNLQPQPLESRIHSYLLPTHSSWVSASAGSGKTKILTDRVLSLLLHGIEPEQILCLTFTKAAAAEMRSRVLSAMSSWQHMSPEELTESLTHLLGDVPNAGLVLRASQLFPLMLEKLQSLKIQTIHSFAQSLLAQFPLEAGIDPHFTILDPLEGDRLFSTCVKRELRRAREDHPEWASEISLYHDQGSFIEKVKAMKRVKPPETETLYQFFGLTENLTREECQRAFLAQFETPLEGSVDDYIKIFLTAEGTIRKRLLPAAEAKKNPEKRAKLEQEAERVLTYTTTMQALDYIAFTEIFLKITSCIHDRYRQAKHRRRVLDYDDLIQKTKDLLRQPDVAPWILYKIDATIGHILVDEAQDTNATQWEIIEALYDDFFKGQQDQARSVFIVGDQKQSIYGFQGAEPAYFKGAGEKLRRATFEGQAGFEQVSLDKSYRSAPAILKAVDAVFNQPRLKKSIGFDEAELKHHIHRSTAPGVVELWPLIVSEKQEKQEGWKLPSEHTDSQHAVDSLVSILTQKIKNSLETGFLYDPLRPIEPKDILILLRKRGKLMGKIVNALKAEGIPVAGADRMVLQDEIVVLDLLNLADFVLCPEDDLALANLLKSPFVGFDDDQLFRICQRKNGSLWDSLDDRVYLEELCQYAKSHAVYDFFAFVLFHRKGLEKLVARLGPECEEVIDAFLNLTLSFENTYTPALQDFVLWMRSLSQELKRDTEEGHNQVRIMTIHGSKGLQAPIVFMAEIASPPQQRLPLIVETEAGDILPARPTIAHEKMLSIKERHQQEERAEYDRLLYVGMTRAQDQLYLMGVKPSRQSAAGSWYEDVKCALEPHAQSFVPDVREGLTLEGPALRLADPVLADIKTAPTQPKKQKVAEIPEWVTCVPVLESESDVTKLNHQDRLPMDEDAIARGIFLHKLCELLPHVPLEKRAGLAEVHLQHSAFAGDFEMHSLVLHVIEMMQEPATKWIFDSGYSELPLKGEIDGIAYDVRLDRLVVQGDDLAIIDYKMSLPENSEAYEQQLGLYKKLVQRIYPQKKIKTYLLGIKEKKLREIS